MSWRNFTVRRLIITLAITTAIMTMGAYAWALLPPSEDFYVNDYAQVLSDSTKKMIIQESTEFARRAFGPQVVVLTINNGLEGLGIEEYARQTGRELAIGGYKMIRGILIVLEVKESICYVELGSGVFRSLKYDPIYIQGDNLDRIAIGDF